MPFIQQRNKGYSMTISRKHIFGALAATAATGAIIANLNDVPALDNTNNDRRFSSETHNTVNGFSIKCVYEGAAVVGCIGSDGQSIAKADVEKVIAQNGGTAGSGGGCCTTEPDLTAPVRTEARPVGGGGGEPLTEEQIKKLQDAAQKYGTEGGKALIDNCLATQPQDGSGPGCGGGGDAAPHVREQLKDYGISPSDFS